MTGLPSLAALEGSWTLVRSISHVGGTTDRFEGEAQFKRSGARLVQKETGVLTVGGQKLEASQRYIWESGAGVLNVYFSDMRPFHTVPLHTEQPETVHLCDPDRYAVRYDFSAWPRWSSRWRVEGPRKDYVMRTEYQRQ